MALEGRDDVRLVDLLRLLLPALPSALAAAAAAAATAATPAPLLLAPRPRRVPSRGRRPVLFHGAGAPLARSRTPSRGRGVAAVAGGSRRSAVRPGISEARQGRGSSRGVPVYGVVVLFV